MRGPSAWLATAMLLVVPAGAVGQASRLEPIPATTPFRFAVIGDNRGYEDASARPIFLAVLERLKTSDVHLLLNTGDLIEGYPSLGENALRRQWRSYLDTVARLERPVFQAPGNHDLFDATSARLWREYVGAPYFAFDHGAARFIVLDTETEPGRIGERQLEWLEGQLEGAGDKHVFVALHRPLFPISAHIGSSLDAIPEERDRLHRVFARHRRAIKGVFAGHEHLYNYEERDGVPYHIVAGAGADLYVPPELGGFHHFVLVEVAPHHVSVQLVKLTAQPADSSVPQVLAGDVLLESWEDVSFWYTWDQGVDGRLTRERASEGRQGFALSYDFSLSPAAILYRPTIAAGAFAEVGAVSADIFVPEGKVNGLRVEVAATAKSKHVAPSVALAPGWNTVVTDFGAPWLPAAERGAIEQIEWMLTGDSGASGFVVFDHVIGQRLALAEGSGSRAAPSATDPGRAAIWEEDWERPLLWGTWGAMLPPEPMAGLSTNGRQALKVPYDFSSSERQILYSAPHPGWNLDRVGALVADVYAPSDGESSSAAVIQLAIGGERGRYESPPRSLATGWNRVRIDLGSEWLPAAALAAVDRIEWIVSPAGRRGPGWIAIDNLRTEPP
jgi:hypothetical protein